MRKSGLVLLLVCTFAIAVAAQTRRPNVNVPRAETGTPEIRGATPQAVTTGTTATVALKGVNLEPGGKIEASGICHLKDGKIVSATEAQVTLTVDDAIEGSCELRLLSHKRWVYMNLNVQLSPAAQQRARQKQQADYDKAMKDMAERAAHIKDILGRKWDVKLPNGRSDTWTVAEVNQFGLVQFKNARGEAFQVIVGDQDAVVVPYPGNCVLQGKIVGGKVGDGQSPLPGCSVGKGAWSATITK